MYGFTHGNVHVCLECKIPQAKTLFTKQCHMKSCKSECDIALHYDEKNRYKLTKVYRRNTSMRIIKNWKNVYINIDSRELAKNKMIRQTEN